MNICKHQIQLHLAPPAAPNAPAIPAPITDTPAVLAGTPAAPAAGHPPTPVTGPTPTPTTGLPPAPATEPLPAPATGLPPAPAMGIAPAPAMGLPAVIPLHMIPLDMLLLSERLYLDPGFEVPQDDAAVVRATGQILTPHQGFQLSDAVVRKIHDPRSLAQGKSQNNAAQVGTDLRKNPPLFQYVCNRCPMDPPGTGTPHQRACVQETAQSIQARMSRIIMQSEVDVCRSRNGSMRFIAGPEFMQILVNTGHGYLLSANERDALQRDGKPA